MHISFLLPAFHSASGGGGAESYVSTMAEALVERGHRVSIIALGKGNLSNGQVRLIQLAAPRWHWFLYRGLPFGKSMAMPVREIEWSRRAWSALMELNAQDPVDVVETGETMVLQQTTRGRKPSVVIRGHGNPLAIKRFSGKRVGWGDRLGRKLQVAGVRRAKAITAVSAFQAGEIARDLDVKQDTISVIPNPISERLLRCALAQTQNEPESPTVLYTGRIEYRKGTLDLLRSTPLVARQFPNVKYLIVGARDSSINNETLDEVLNQPDVRLHVEFCGHVPWQQLAEWYARASVFVMPSYYETFGISVIEAMAFGLPVVATNAGGLPEVVQDNVTGILVPPKDPNALADAIVRLLRDPELRRRLGNAGRERVLSEFTTEHIVDQTLEVYENACRLDGR